MKIEIIVDENVNSEGSEKPADVLVRITCRKRTPEVEKILAALRMMDHQFTAKKDDEIHILDITQIIYIESVDRKSFIYTPDEVYESDFRLYELEQQLEEYGFFRASKSCLIHLQNIQSLKAEINRKIRATMSNGEQIIVSRQYAEELKRRLGL